MKKFIIAVMIGLMASLASAKVEVKAGKFYFNNERQELVWGRSSFKLSNIVTHHYTGNGGGKYGLGYALSWVHHNQAIFGPHVVLRVLLESEGWSPCDTYNGVPENCMFGSEPRNQGFWNLEELRDNVRTKDLTPVGHQVLEWFYITSSETGAAFELVIDATLKHNDIPAGEINHVIRQVGVHMGELQLKYPNALIIPNLRNEWNAHNQSRHTLADVNMWATRWDRDNYTPTWNAPKIVNPGGSNTFTYDVGPEPGKYRAGMIHPSRDSNWANFPSQEQMNTLRQDARGMPVGSTESMYWVNAEDNGRAQAWYRAGGWTSNWLQYRQHLTSLEAAGFDYIIIHDEKGVQCNPAWPRAETRMEKWAKAKFGGITPPPPIPPVKSPYEHLINDMYQRILLRAANPAGMAAYTEWLAQCYVDNRYTTPCHTLVEDSLIQSDEYKDKFGEVVLPPPPPPPPPAEVEVTDYLRIERARELDCALSNNQPCSENRLQALTWRGWRDLEGGAYGCPTLIQPVFGITAAEMMELAQVGGDLVYEGRTKFEIKLSEVNRRCDTLPDFCNRSNVRKAVWSDYNVRLEEHGITVVELYTHLNGQPGFGTAYDSISAWCQYMQENPQ